MEISATDRAEAFIEYALSGELRKVRLMLSQHPALLDYRDDSGNNPLHLLCQLRLIKDQHVKVAETLIKSGVSPTQKGRHPVFGECSGLVMACGSSTDCVSLVKLLLRKKCSANEESENGQTPLGAASEMMSVESCRALLDKKAEMTIHAACALGWKDVAYSMLRENDEEAWYRDYYRRATPLYYAARNDHRDLVEMLIDDYEVPVSAEDNRGNTPLHVACANGAGRAVDALLKRNADVNARNWEKQTPLHWAVEEWRTENTQIILELITAGASVNALDEKKQTPLAKARFLNKTHIVELLSKHGARE